MKRIFTYVIIGSLCFACSNEPKKNMTVNGTIKGIKKGKLYLQKMIDTALVNVDSVSLFDANTFELKDYVESPVIYYLTFDGNTTDKSILFFGEPTTITITDELEKFGFAPKISGSKNQEVFENYQKVIKKFIDERLDLIKQEFDASKDENQTLVDEIRTKIEKLERRRILYTTNFALSNADFEVAPFIALTDLYDVNIQLLDTINNKLSSKVKQSIYGKRLENYLTKIKKSEK